MFIFIDRDHPAHKELGMTDFDFDEDLSTPDTALSERYREDCEAFSSDKYLNMMKAREQHRDDEGYLHHDTEPAVRGKDGIVFYVKHGYAHKADGPAARLGYLDQPHYWYFYEGKCLGMASEGWIQLWRITKNKDIFECLDYSGPHGDRSHNLKELLSLITKEDLQDEVLFDYIWHLVKCNFVPPEVPEDDSRWVPPMELDDYEWDEQAI